MVSDRRKKRVYHRANGGANGGGAGGLERTKTGTFFILKGRESYHQDSRGFVFVWMWSKLTYGSELRGQYGALGHTLVGCVQCKCNPEILALCSSFSSQTKYSLLMPVKVPRWPIKWGGGRQSPQKRKSTAFSFSTSWEPLGGLGLIKSSELLISIDLKSHQPH